MIGYATCAVFVCVASCIGFYLGSLATGAMIAGKPKRRVFDPRDEEAPHGEVVDFNRMKQAVGR